MPRRDLLLLLPPGGVGKWDNIGPKINVIADFSKTAHDIWFQIGTLMENNVSNNSQ